MFPSTFFLLSVLSISSVVSYLSEIEINAMNMLYKEWNGPYCSGCQWNMTQINDRNHTNYINDQCGAYFNNYTRAHHQYVDKIRFPDFIVQNLTGTIPSIISNLTNLSVFEPVYNNLYGTVPNAFCKMKNLAKFLIYGNDFIGSIPKCIFDLPQIHRFALYDTPNISITNTNINQLCDNKNIIHQFDWLQLHNVNYSGTFPFCIGEKLQQLIYLQFSTLYHLTGIIPANINNLINLLYIYLYELPAAKISVSPQNKTFLDLTKLNKLVHIALDLSFVEMNLSDLCHLNLTEIYLVYYIENDDETKNMINIPNQCIFQDKNNLYSFQITGNGFKGSINNSLCSQNETLQDITIIDTKYVHIDIPKCLLRSFISSQNK